MDDRLSHDDLLDIRESIIERAAIIEFDGGRPRKVAEALAESSLRVYLAAVRDSADSQSAIKRVTIITHGETLDQVTADCNDRFGADRVVSVRAYQGSLCLSE